MESVLKNEKLIEAVCLFPCLWQVNTKSYKDVVAKANENSMMYECTVHVHVCMDIISHVVYMYVCTSSVMFCTCMYVRHQSCSVHVHVKVNVEELTS